MENIQLQGKNERLEYLDFLRGIAVLGLLFMNMPYMGAFDTGYVQHDPSLLSDDIMLSIRAFLFDGRFRSLFCMLFAIGLFIQFKSYQSKNLNFYIILKSRLNWLLVFGLLHCIFIWSGDILILYALCGFYLLRYLDEPTDKLFRKGKLFFTIGIVIFTLECLLWSYLDTPIVRDSAQFLETYDTLNEGYGATLVINLFTALFYILTFPVLSLFYLCGVMMLGLALFKSGQLQNGFSQKHVRLLFVITIVVSTTAACLSIFTPGIGQYLDEVLGSVSGLAMALLIWHWVITTRLYSSLNIISIAIKHVGTMAFTFYIFQSITGTMLLRYLYPEWNLSFDLIDYVGLALSLIVIQLVVALIYKRVFHQGPLEYIWRRLVNRVRLSQISESGVITDSNNGM